jgi:hypothetical protein
MSKPVKIIAAAEMDRMTLQERADVVDTSIIQCWPLSDPTGLALGLYGHGRGSSVVLG